MSAHPWIEDLVITSVDASPTVQQQNALHEHLADCAECRALADAYRADQRRLRAIAFEPAPAWIRSAIFDRPRRARTARPAWTVAVAALALLATLIAIAVGATLQRPTLSVVPIGPIGWLTPADATRVVGGASVDGGWLVAVADESLTATQLRIYRPETGWTADGEFDALAAGAGAVIQVGPQSSELNTFAYSTDRGILLTRDRSGVWTRHDLDATRLILDVAVQGKAVWVLAEPARPLDASESKLSLLSSGTGFSMADGPSEVRVTGVRLAASTDRLAVAGCSTREPGGCELVIYSSSHHARGWTRAALPRDIDLRTRIGGQAVEATGRGTLLTQLVALDDRFFTIVPGEAGGTEIWSSSDGVAWERAGEFASAPYPVGLVTDGSTVVGVGGSPGELWLWTLSGQGSWVGSRVDIGVDSPTGIAVAGNRIFALGVGPTSVDGWQIEIRR